MNNKGNLVIVCGPSGVGKGTVCRKWVLENPDIVLSVSATTRKPRAGEEDGMHYHFKTKMQFEQMIKQNALLEWAEYCNHYYGTPKAYIDKQLQQGKDVVLEIDVQGALSVKKQYPEGIFVFICPPSIEELTKRIRGRGTEAEDVIVRRLKRANDEMKYIKYFDYIVINDEVSKAVQRIHSIVVAEKCSVKKNYDIIKEWNK